MRPTNEHERRDIKAVCNRALRQVGAANFVHDTRVSEGQLSRYGSLTDADYMPVDIIADLERVAGYPLITERLAALSGYALVPVACAATAPDMNDVAELVAAKGKLTPALIVALMDGWIDPREEREIAPLLDDLIEKLSDFRRGLYARAC